MRVLLDECLPRRLARLLGGHEVRTVPEAGWPGKQNGELLKLAQGHYDVFVTLDKGVAFQNVLPADLAVVTLKAETNRIESLKPLVPELLEVLGTIKPGQHVRVGG